MLRTWQYWILLIMYILANATGLMIVGYASPMGQQLAHITTAQASAVGQHPSDLQYARPLSGWSHV